MLPTLGRSAKTIENPEKFFAMLGDIHDAELESFELDICNDAIIIKVADLYNNFYQTSEYPGKLDCEFIASNLSDLMIDVVINKIAYTRILGFFAIQNVKNEKIAIEIRLNEGWIKFRCGNLIGMIR